MPINQPSNQIKLTNVSLVRYKKAKKRFEIACYKNKVLEWRSGIEKDLDNVLQIPNVFLNVSKGQTAPNADLAKAFGPGVPVQDIILEILNKGELQVGEKERHAQLERVHNEVVGIVASKLVDPKTKRVYTTGMIEKALEMLSSQGSQAQQDKPAGSGAGTPITGEDGEGKPKAKEHAWTGVILKQAVKSAAPKSADADTEDGDDKAKGTVKDRVLGYVEQVETQDVMGSEWEVVGFVEPGAFKALGDFISTETKGQGRVEVLDMAVTHED
ncbi:UPF0023 family protein [Rutstroemia sp. NJR-2017a BBW]|nr:UPF0023 family protein [Rutstroemia sp. NJR-2017a BBW]